MAPGAASHRRSELTDYVIVLKWYLCPIEPIIEQTVAINPASAPIEQVFAASRAEHRQGGRLPGPVPNRADRLASGYLRAAQAYMLISMPTGTSTIFGVFQVIRVVLPSTLVQTRSAREHRPGLE